MPTQINYCKVDDCETRCHGKGYCLMHYKRVMKHGTTDKHTWAARSGYTVSAETREKIKQTLTGRKLSGEHRRNIRQGMVGKIKTGSESAHWLEAGLTYSGVHAWVRRTLGTPSTCENCSVTSGITFDWANLSGEYLRDESDWARLCRRCHFLMDGVGLQYRLNGGLQ